MEQPSLPLWKRTLVALVRGRKPRGVWLYTVCAILVVLYALSVLYGIGAEAPPSGPRLSDFVIPALWLSFPAAVALVQVWHQTLLGWLLLLGEFGLAAVAVCYWFITDRLAEPWPLIILAILVPICVGLVQYRPTR